MFQGAFGSTDALTATALKATPLLFVGVGITIAFRANVINIGGEGQMVAGGLLATAVALVLPDLPAVIMLPAVLIAGIVGGAIWGAVPGALKAYYGVNEILSTIMLNVVAVQLMNYLLRGPLIDPGEIERGTRIPQTERLQEGADLPLLFGSGRLHIGPFIAVLVAVVAYILLWRTPLGYRLRAVGQNTDAARYAGIPVKRTIVLAMTLSGAMGGLAGAVLVFGVESHRMVTDGSTAGFTGSAGFNGIVAALFGGAASAVDHPGLVPLRRTARRRQRHAACRPGADRPDPRPQRPGRDLRRRQRSLSTHAGRPCITGRDRCQARRRDHDRDTPSNAAPRHSATSGARPATSGRP